MRLYLFIIVSLYSSISIALTVGVETTDYAPYFYLDQEEKYQGAAREIIDLFARSQKVELDYHPMPVPRLFNEFVKGHIDLKFPDNPLWSASLQSNVLVYYSTPVLDVKEALIIIESNKTKYNKTIKEKEIKIVGSILGFSTPGIEKNIEKQEFELVRTKKVEQLIHMLASDRVDAIYFNADVAIDIAKKLYPNKKLLVYSKYPVLNYAYHLSSIKHQKLINEFNQFLVDKKIEVKAIKSRYGL